MKDLNCAKSSGVIVLALLLILLLGACKKEVIEKPYPDELTIYNCEEFLHAPQERVDEIEQKERLDLAVNNPDSVLPPDNLYYDPLASMNLDSGHVIAYDGSWRNIEYVRVIGNDFSTYTTAEPSATNYRMSRSFSGGKSLSVGTNYLNGVTALDRLMIMRHLEGIRTFTTYAQMCAADVDGNDVVDSRDELLIRDAVTGAISEFPSGNVHFIPEAIYVDREQNWLNSNVFDNWTFFGATAYNDYRAIKVGDVNGSFNF